MKEEKTSIQQENEELKKQLEKEIAKVASTEKQLAEEKTVRDIRSIMNLECLGSC